MQVELQSRNELIKKLHSDGNSYRQIAALFNMTFQNVALIVRDIKRKRTVDDYKIDYLRRLAKSVAVESGLDISVAYDKFGVPYKRMKK